MKDRLCIELRPVGLSVSRQFLYRRIVVPPVWKFPVKSRPVAALWLRGDPGSAILSPGALCNQSPSCHRHRRSVGWHGSRPQ